MQSDIVMDNSSIKKLGDHELIKNKSSNVYLLQDIWKSNKNTTSFNEFQCKIYANCEHFISVQGGNSVLCSYFGGINLIYCRRGKDFFLKNLITFIL